MITEVYLLVYSHKHGEDYSAYATHDQAMEGVAAIARQFWPDEFPDEDDHLLTDQQVIERYFDDTAAGQEESVEIRALTVRSADDDEDEGKGSAT